MKYFVSIVNHIAIEMFNTLILSPIHAFLILSSPTRHSLRLQAHFMLYQPVLGVCPYDFRKIPQYLWYFVVTAVFFFLIIWCNANGNPNIQAPSLFLQSFKGSLILEHCITFAFNRGDFF